MFKNDVMDLVHMLSRDVENYIMMSLINKSKNSDFFS